MNKDYRELSTSICANKRLKIDLIYDRPFLTGTTVGSWYAVLPIEEIFIPNKRQEIIVKLKKCCEVI